MVQQSSACIPSCIPCKSTRRSSQCIRHLYRHVQTAPAPNPKKRRPGASFLCLKPSKYTASSAFSVLLDYLSFGYSGIAACQVLIVGILNHCLKTISCQPKTSPPPSYNSRESSSSLYGHTHSPSLVILTGR